jgi:putative ABC transport system permease protein
LVKAIDKKLLRDLWLMRSQVVTIALVVAAGIAGFVGSLSTYDSLRTSLASYYDTARFADIFSDLKRAPKSVEHLIAAIPGVADVETTINFDVTLDLPDATGPTIGRMIGLVNGAQPRLNKIFIRRGRMIESSRANEVIVSEGFALAHKLQPGDHIAALLNGKRETLAIVGIALSPEYVYAWGGGALPDPASFGVFWIDRTRLAGAFSMEGAFNRVAIRLASDASALSVIEALDRVLAPYGGLNAHGRDEQPSHRFLSQEIDQQKVMGTILPIPFFGVAMFLLNVVLSRIVSSQREQIAALKAVGYANRTIAAHYLKLVLLIAGIGIVIGLGVGFWFGHYMTSMYTRFFHFPRFLFHVELWIVLVAAGISLLVAIGGALHAVGQVVTLAPAQAMRPPTPLKYRKMLIERYGLAHWLSPGARMVVRTLERRPLRALVTIVGIASGVGVLISGTFWWDSVEYLIDVQFQAIQRADTELALVEPMSSYVRREVENMPGVRRVEVSRMVPVRLVAGHHWYRTAIQGIAQGAQLRRLLDSDLREVPLPSDGLVLTERLATRLGVRPGDKLRVESLEGKRHQRDVVVAGLVNELIGLSAYMNIAALNRFMGEGDLVSAISLALDRSAEGAFFTNVKKLPRIATAASKTTMLRNFNEVSAKNILFFTTMFTAFASVIAFGIVYNSARVSLAERAWELASLRVLGFTRREVSTFLLGELAIQTALAIPLGFPAGYFIAWGLVQLMPHETMSLPLIIQPRTYAYAALATLTAALISALVVQRRIDKLDLVAVLKTRE